MQVRWRLRILMALSTAFRPLPSIRPGGSRAMPLHHLLCTHSYPSRGSMVGPAGGTASDQKHRCVYLVFKWQKCTADEMTWNKNNSWNKIDIYGTWWGCQKHLDLRIFCLISAFLSFLLPNQLSPPDWKSGCLVPDPHTRLVTQPVFCLLLIQPKGSKVKIVPLRVYVHT